MKKVLISFVIALGLMQFNAIKCAAQQDELNELTQELQNAIDALNTYNNAAKIATINNQLDLAEKINLHIQTIQNRIQQLHDQIQNVGKKGP